MFLKNIFQFLKGYVILLIKGNSVGHFINVCMNRNIYLWNIKKTDEGHTSLYIFARDFKKLRSVARKTNTQVHIREKHGLYVAIKKYKKRIFYIIGFIVFILSVAISTRFIWSVEVVGSENREEILKAARLAGVRSGAYKASLPDGNEIKNTILTNTDDLTWAWVYLKGTKAIIEVRESIKPPELIDKVTPTDVIAVRDGIITEMIVKKGIAFSKVGDVVLKGDLLLGGTNTDSEGNYKLEHAMGEIYAKTTHKAKGQIKLYRDVRNKTGRKKIFLDLNLLSKTFPLYPEVFVPYEEYDVAQEKRTVIRWGKSIAELISTVYEEVDITRIPLDEDIAAKSVCYELEAQIAENLLPDSRLLNKEMSCEKIDDETIEVTLIMEFLEQIGEEVPLT